MPALKSGYVDDGKPSIERLLNLMFVLMHTKHPLKKEELRSRISGYDPDASFDAFDKMFDRDKKSLLASGIPLEVVPVDPGFSDVVGYRINREEWLLPKLQFTEEERDFLALASHAWTDSQVEKLATHAAESMADVEHDGDIALRLGLAQFQTGVNQILEALAENRVISFAYRKRNETEATIRKVEPWHLVVKANAWYLVGFDSERMAQRTFKLNRVQGEITLLNELITHSKPGDFDAEALVATWVESNNESAIARIHVHQKQAGHLRLRAQEILQHPNQDELVIAYADQEALARDIAMVCEHVLAVEPAALRDAVTSIIRGTQEQHRNV